MASVDVYDVIEQRCRSLLLSVQFVFENEEFSLPDTPAAFVYCEIFGDIFAEISIGSPGQNLQRESGQFLAHVTTPNGTGSRAARVLAKQIINLFFAQESGGVQFKDASLGSGDPGREFGNYYALTASIAWERDA